MNSKENKGNIAIVSLLRPKMYEQDLHQHPRLLAVSGFINLRFLLV